MHSKINILRQITLGLIAVEIITINLNVMPIHFCHKYREIYHFKIKQEIF